jgi:poly(3-hydroxybutyrate) depolymerase
MPDRFSQVVFPDAQTLETNNVVYGSNVDWEGNAVNLRLDFYEPNPTLDPLPKRPLIIYAHGGGLEGGSKSNVQAKFWGKRFARAGYTFASVDYRVGWGRDLDCGGDTTNFKLALYRATQDFEAATRFLMEFADLLRIDTNHIYIMGNSAGAAVCQTAANYVEGDFSTFVRDSLGPLRGASNTYINHNPVYRGIISKAAGIDKMEVLGRSSIPQLLFHGTCDLTVPYTEGRLYWCYNPNPYSLIYGSRRLAEYLDGVGTCRTLYTNENAGHGAVEPDTVLIKGLEFLKTLLCNDCNSQSITRTWPADVCSNNVTAGGVLQEVFPNPVGIQLNVQVAVSDPSEVIIKIYDLFGDKVIHLNTFATPPETALPVAVNSLSPGIYMLAVHAEGVWSKAKFIKSNSSIIY